MRSFLSWCRGHGWPAGDLQLAPTAARWPATTRRRSRCPSWSGCGGKKIPLRERALWRLLYDSASRAEAVLGLDVPDLDLANRQARARVKGGDIHLLHFQTGAARLLRNLTAGREAGPVFLTARRAASHRVTAAADLDPESGKARLSYEMAEQISRNTPAAAPCTSCGTPGSPTSATRTSAPPC